MFQNIFARFKVSTEPEAQVNNKIAEQPPKESLIDGYAVVDVETTGLFPSRDRIIEIAIISIDKNLQIEEEFTTLINPVRDLGATNIHQITAAMVSEAPRFEEVVGDVIKRIKNRKIVGHNVQFDVSMLLGELARLNITVKEPPRLCTLRLAYKLGPSKRNLRACCEHFGIPLDRPHCALEDARATLELLNRYKHLAKAKELHELHNLGCYLEGNFDNYPDLQPTNRVFTRKDSKERPKPTYLHKLIEQLPEAGSADIAQYYAALDRVLEDRKVTDTEIEELQKLAEAAELSRTAVLEAHRDYIRGLVRIALADQVISISERNDLECVTNLLGFETTHLDDLIELVKAKPLALLGSPNNCADFLGKKVCFTGELTSKLEGKPISRETALKLVGEKGMIATDSVTKATDILVLADPDSVSGKAKKARQYGIRLMTDRAFFSYIGINVD